MPAACEELGSSDTSQIEHVIPNEKLRCNAAKHEAGGGGINVSRAIQRLGGECLAIFPCGGPNATLLTKTLMMKILTM